LHDLEKKLEAAEVGVPPETAMRVQMVRIESVAAAARARAALREPASEQPTPEFAERYAELTDDQFKVINYLDLPRLHAARKCRMTPSDYTRNLDEAMRKTGARTPAK